MKVEMINGRVGFEASKAREEIEANEKNVLFALCELSGHFLMPSKDYIIF